MKKKDPEISVIMGVYCSEESISTLESAIDSILNQTFKNFELLICENNSSEKVKEAILKIASKDTRIRIIDGTGLTTLASKLNRCISCSRGRLIARMDHDDFSYPERFEKQLVYLKEIEHLSGVGTCVREIGGVKEYKRMLPENPTLNDFKKTLPFVHPTLIIKRKSLIAIGGYSESIYQCGCEDYDLLFRLLSSGSTVNNVQEVLMDYSILSSQINKRPYRLFLNEYYTRKENFKAKGLLPQWSFWVLKPLLVGLLPRKFVHILKRAINEIPKRKGNGFD